MILARLPRSVLWASGLLLAPLSFALAASADGGGKKPSELIFLTQIAILILVGRVLGELMQRIGQPSVMGQLLGGLLLGPSVFGLVWPSAQHAIFPNDPAQKAMIDAVSQLGVLLLLLLTGMETDLKLVRRVGRASIVVSIAGICLPFVCGWTLGHFMPADMLPHPDRRLIASLFLGTALSISSVKIVAMVVREMNFMRRNLGQIILASSIIDDTIGWIIIAIIFSLASRGTIDVVSVGEGILGTAVFLAFSLTIGRRLVFSLIRMANDYMVIEVPVISVILLLMAGMALTTHLIGVHTVLGAFVAGILVGESPILTKQIDTQLRGLIMGLFAPVFFGIAGLSADMTILKDPKLLLFTAGLIAIASVGKASGAFVGGKIGGLSVRESVALACAMNARGSTEVIIATIGLSMGVLTHDLFTMIVAMAMTTTMAMPPMLRWALSRVPLAKEEKERIEREEFEDKGFVANLERILLAVDSSANAKFASHLAGLVAGTRGIPTTVMHIGRQANRDAKEKANDDSPEKHLKHGAKQTAETEEKIEDQKPPKVDILTKARDRKSNDAIAAEAGKGYDLLIIGLDKTTTKKGEFSAGVTRAAASFDGALAITAGRGKAMQDPEPGKLGILVPVTGTDVSRRAAELGVALARALDVPITALYVSSNGKNKRRVNRALATRRYEEAILKEFVQLAERYDIRAHTDIEPDDAPDDAILREARRRKSDLIVMGVNRRPGNMLFFGNVAAEVLANSETSVLLVSGTAPPA